MQQNATETNEGRLCRHDKTMLLVFITNILVILIWSVSLNLSASSAENTETEETANGQIMQTETIERYFSVGPKEFAVTATETETTTLTETTTTTATSVETTVSETTTITTEAETQPTETSSVVTEEVATTEEMIVSEEVTIEETQPDTISEETESYEQPVYTGPALNAQNGVVQGPSGKETYYNLDMSGVVSNMNSLGYYEEYWVREDGCKMFGPYIMCAANLDVRPRGSIVETSLGQAIVCDTGGFASSNPYQLDIAVTW